MGTRFSKWLQYIVVSISKTHQNFMQLSTWSENCPGLPTRCRTLTRKCDVYLRWWWPVCFIVLLWLAIFFCQISFYFRHRRWASWWSPLQGCTRSRARCWAGNRLSHQPEPSGRALHGEVGGLDIGRQPCQSLFFLHRHTHMPLKGSYPFV